MSLGSVAHSSVFCFCMVYSTSSTHRNQRVALLFSHLTAVLLEVTCMGAISSCVALCAFTTCARHTEQLAAGLRLQGRRGTISLNSMPSAI